MASLTHPTKSERGQMNRAHDQLTYILKEARSPNEMGKILDEYYNDGKITVSFIKTLQLHIDICVKRQDFEQAQKLMSIYQAIEVRAKKKRGSTEDDKIQLAKKQLKLLFDVDGDVQKMAQKLTTLLRAGDIDLKIFKRLLKINIEIAEERGWSTKIDVLKVITRIVNEFEKVSKEGTSDVHHPTFTLKEKGEGDGTGESAVVDGAAADLIIDISGLASLLTGKGGNGNQRRRGNKKKKKSKGDKVQVHVNKIGKQLNECGWAVCDGFISNDVCKAVRDEIEQLQPHFEASEIFVGKENEVGAHISVPSVRGDKVLWMCGGHRNENSRQFDSAGLQPKTRGDVAPCQPTIKSALPMSKFVVLKEVMKSIDQLVFEKLKKKVSVLNGLSERSDCMLAKYADGGRFQRHIDNTTQDGRKLTLLCYLNPGKWVESDGGSLRLHPNGSNPVDVYPEGGRLAMFFSDLIEHEVRPTYGNRFALTMWYYDRNERLNAVKKAEKIAKEKGVGNTDMALNIEAQEVAREFISEMFNDTTLPLKELLTNVQQKVNTLDDVAKDIVGSVVGVEKDKVEDVIEKLSVEEFFQLRESFQKMGI
jgi:Rps23 Pro-64 3,4-dihydroxylase Tpa1-like proline 4-hydroxylase